ncbi:MAG: CAP domain-containing protein [Planctomycetota bacterium]
MRPALPITVLLLGAAACAQTEATAEETELLCWLNRFRRDPQAFARLVVDGHKPENAEHVDWTMFAAEMAELKPAPPLFFESRLIDASRAHARYMVEAKEYGHHETPGRPGFTGEAPVDRARAAGYTASVEECSWARGGTALEIVAGYVVDAGAPGTGSGGMQEGRGHRRCMIDGRHREVGVGLFAWGKGLMSSVKLYGRAPGVDRVLGGVAITDRDGDEFYDVGEGLGGVHILVGDRCTMTSGSGAWRLDLPGDNRAKKLVARLGSIELVRDIAPGKDNLLIDLIFDIPGVVAGLEATLAKLPDDAAAQQRVLRLRLLELRPPATPAETQLAGEVGELKASVLAGLGIWSRQEATNAFQAGKHAFTGTVVDDWIRQAQIADALARSAAEIRGSKNAKARAKQAGVLVVDIERQLADITSVDLWRTLAEVRRSLLGM